MNSRSSVGNTALERAGQASWTVAIGAALGLSVAFGPAFIASFGLYVKPIAAEFGWSRTGVSALYALVSILGAAGTPFLGFLLDRHGARPFILLSALILPLALLLLVWMPANYTIFLACGALIGLASIIASPTAYVSLLPQWFSARLGMAVAIGMFGSGLGQFAFAQAHGELLSRFDWRTSWAVMAGVVALIGIPVALLTARDNPRLRHARVMHGEKGLEGTDLATALRAPAYWAAVVSFFIVLLITTGMLTHLAPFLTDRGWSIEHAATAIGLIGLVSLAGRALSGALLDRFGFGVLGLLIFPLQAVGCIVLVLMPPGLSTFFAAACIGLCYGVEADMMPWMLRRTFGLRCFGRLYGIGFGVVQIGAVLGPLLLGYSFDFLGGYRSGLLVLAGLSLLATLLIGLAACLAERRAAANPTQAGFN